MNQFIDESQIKRKIIDIIRTFRSLGFMTDSDVTINELEEEANIYRVLGEYNFKNSFSNNQKNEKGSFEISLDSTLKPKKVKITPDKSKI
jgi:hypothetical protein